MMMSERQSVQVYQSLDRELQRHVSLRDTLQQCQTWLFNIQEELQPPAQTPRYLEEALIQVHVSQNRFCVLLFIIKGEYNRIKSLDFQLKQERALQEQASTYLQLICSTCDLTDEKVRETAADIQQVKIQVIYLTLPFNPETTWQPNCSVIAM